MSKTYLFFCPALVLLLGIWSCGSREEKPAAAPPEASPVSEAPTPLDPETAATVTGMVRFEGTAPQGKEVVMKTDPFCLRQHPQAVRTEEVLVNDNGTLRNVFVYVKEGLGNRSFPPPAEPVLLDQKGCWYDPHVFGLRGGQPLQIRNSDNTLHNIRTTTRENPAFNIAQPIKGMVNIKTFQKPEVMISFKCDVHPWMISYGAVLAHPYFAVTGNEGRFQLTPLPPGPYVIEAWHERYGTQMQTVQLGEKETKEIVFAFKGK
ncbi:MAG: hypothetical protein HY652_04840 [Acidobacteria bacterium]|nr:hypothetical protein [Acidobacteriota bacterium]